MSRNSFRVVFPWKLAVVAILTGGGAIVHPLKSGGANFALEEGGGGKGSDPQVSHFVAPPPPPRNYDQSLKYSYNTFCKRSIVHVRIMG